MFRPRAKSAAVGFSAGIVLVLRGSSSRPRGRVPPLKGLGDFICRLPSTPLRCVPGYHYAALATRRAQNQRATEAWPRAGAYGPRDGHRSRTVSRIPGYRRKPARTWGTRPENRVLDLQKGGLMDAFTETLLAKADQLAALADQLPAGELRQQIVDQIAALNKAITQHGEG